MSRATPLVGQGQRRHPPARVGDRFGDRVVVRLLPRGHKGRSDERVVFRCSCGFEGETYVANLRVVQSRCTGRHPVHR